MGLADKMLGDHVASMGKVGTQAMGCATFIAIGLTVLFVAPNPGWGLLVMGAGVVIYFWVSLSKSCPVCKKRLGGAGYRWEIDGKTKEICFDCYSHFKEEQSKNEPPQGAWLPPNKRDITDLSPE